MNNFETHGIKHLSASSVNAYAEDAAYWCAKYLYGAKFPFSPAARAGVLTEEAVVNVLARGFTAEDAIKDAEKEYTKATIFGRDENTQKRGDAIRPMVELALEELVQYGEPEFEPDGGQKRVSIDCNLGDFKVPIIGYLDLYFPSHGLVVDLKTTSRMPTEMSDSHKRQQAIYKAANGNHDVKFLYVTPKKSQVFDCPDDYKETLAEIKTIVRRMNALLELPLGTIKDVIPVHTSFYWTDSINIRKEIYGI